MSQLQQIQKQKDSLFVYCLKRIYGLPASLSIITGLWKTGKTDFSLWLSEQLRKIQIKRFYKNTFYYRPLIDTVASNIEDLSDNPSIEYITSLDKTRLWLREGKNKRKLFINDEINKTYTRRRAMSSISVETIRLFGELSKAHGHLIMVGQDILGSDSEFLNPTWCRAIWFKTSLKVVQLNSHLIEGEKTFRDLPRTSIKFDPYKIAPMTEHEPANTLFKEEDKALLWRWCNGESCETLGLHPMQLNRMARKFVKEILSPKAEANIT